MTTPRLGRNHACRCGSGRKYKKCCLPRDLQKRFRLAFEDSPGKRRNNRRDVQLAMLAVVSGNLRATG